MATILEGLNKLSGALGGAETATENLEALNAIAGALGGETNATNNADAIDQIAEHASGGGGSSDFSTATVTVTCYDESIGLIGYSGMILTGFAISQAHDGLVLGIGSPSNTPATWDVVLWDGTASFVTSVDPSTIAVSVAGDIEYSDGEFFINGDGTITISLAQ